MCAAGGDQRTTRKGQDTPGGGGCRAPTGTESPHFCTDIVENALNGVLQGAATVEALHERIAELSLENQGLKKVREEKEAAETGLREVNFGRIDPNWLSLNENVP